jgi:TolA-binding protein
MLKKRSIVIVLLVCVLVITAIMHLRDKGDWDWQARQEWKWWPGRERSLFSEGRLLVTDGHYQEAIGALRGYLGEYPDGSYGSRARFFVAKAYLGLGQLALARVEFQTTIKIYPESLEAHKSRYKLGMIDLWEGKRRQAHLRFQELAEAPDGPLAPEAAAMSNYLNLTVLPEGSEA